MPGLWRSTFSEEDDTGGACSHRPQPVAVQCLTPNGVRRRASSERCSGCKSAAGTLSRPMARTALTRPAPRRASQFPPASLLPSSDHDQILDRSRQRKNALPLLPGGCRRLRFLHPPPPPSTRFFHLDVGAANAELLLPLPHVQRRMRTFLTRRNRNGARNNEEHEQSR
ncbi:hypothetical protein MTO96_013911 [Rhipicephalus appendiculatus]